MNDRNKLENVVFAAASDPNVQKAILESDNVMNALRELKSGEEERGAMIGTGQKEKKKLTKSRFHSLLSPGHLALEAEDSSNLLPMIARAAEATVITDTEEEKSFLEGVKDAIHKASHAVVLGFNRAKSFIQNLFGSEENKAKAKADEGNKSSNPDEHPEKGFGKMVVYAVVFVLMVVVLKRGGFRMGPVRA